MSTYHEKLLALKRFAWDVIDAADTIDSTLENEARQRTLESINRIDPERWHVARGFATKIIEAIDSGPVAPAPELLAGWLNGLRDALRDLSSRHRT